MEYADFTVAIRAITEIHSRIKAMLRRPEPDVELPANSIVSLLDKTVNLRNDMIRLEMARGGDVKQVALRYKLNPVRVAAIASIKPVKKSKSTLVSKMR